MTTLHFRRRAVRSQLKNFRIQWIYDDNKPCAYCGLSLYPGDCTASNGATVDHIVPLAVLSHYYDMDNEAKSWGHYHQDNAQMQVVHRHCHDELEKERKEIHYQHCQGDIFICAMYGHTPKGLARARQDVVKALKRILRKME